MLLFLLGVGIYQGYRYTQLPEEGMSLSEASGEARVLSANSRAEEIGFRRDDVVVAVNGQPVTGSIALPGRWRLVDAIFRAFGRSVSRTFQMSELLQGALGGSTIPYDIRRGEERITLQVPVRPAGLMVEFLSPFLFFLISMFLAFRGTSLWLHLLAPFALTYLAIVKPDTQAGLFGAVVDWSIVGSLIVLPLLSRGPVRR